jgi:DNA polymerase III subunit delta'
VQFNDVIGLETQKGQLIREVNADRISHAQLFLGKTGYGTFPLALAFVQYILCEQPTETDSCGVCSSCKKVAQMQHPDVHFSFPTVQTEANVSDLQFSLWKDAILANPFMNLNSWIEISDDKGRRPIISKHESEAIVKKLSLKSFEGGYKVVIMWMADEMNDTCANKLLKIIEEPPAKTLFLLLAENQQSIMPTILSRTQLQKIKQIPDDALISFLKRQGVVSNEILDSIVSRSEGDMNAALEIVSASEDVQQNRNDFIQMMRVCYKKDVIAMLDWAESVAQKGREQHKNYLKYCLFMIRQSLMKNYTDNQLVRASKQEKEFLEKFARFITGNNVMDFNKLFSEAHYAVERNAHAKMLFLHISFEVMRYIHRA